MTSATSWSYAILAAASLALLLSVRSWHRTVTVGWAIPDNLMTVPGPFDTVKDAPSASVQKELDLLLSAIVAEASAHGERDLKSAESTIRTGKELAQAHQPERRRDRMNGDLNGGTPAPSGGLPISLAALYATRRKTPRDVEMPRLRQGTDAEGTIQFINNAFLATLNNAEKIVENATFAVNTVDKLTYQLSNWEPMKHTFSVPQWNPLRVVDMPKHTREHPQRYFMMGVSSVKRKHDYLMQMLRSFIGALNSAERQRIQIVVLNANVPPSAHTEIETAKAEFAAEVANGLLKFIEREDGEQPYPEMANPKRLARRWGDSLDRVKWRSKQVLDVSYLMEYCYINHERFDYFLMMEDDIIAAKQFPTKVRAYVDTLYTRTDWTMVSFYNPWDDVTNGESLPPYKYKGVIGQLFRMHDLPVVVEFLKKNFDQSPLDWLFVDFLKKFDGHLVQHSPSYFQHVGKVSSMDEKVQGEGAVDFEPG